jgi:YbbR domain-containing protein
MKDFMRRYVLHNLVLKLVSLGFAVSLWLAVSRDPIAEVALDVPIEFHNIPQNLDISSENIPQAQIRLRGPQRIVRGVRASDVYADIDLTNFRPGERTFDLTARQIHVPSGLQVVQVIPSQLHLSFDAHVSREVEVHPRVIGTFAEGYRIKDILVEPAKVAISGPRKRVEAVEAALTDPLDVSGATDRVTLMRHAYVSDPVVQVANPEPVRVTIIMEQAPIGSVAR